MIRVCSILLAMLQLASSMSGMGFTSLDGWPSSGVTNVRIWDIGVTWRDIHLGVDVYDWSRLDSVVAQIESIGAKITYVCDTIHIHIIFAYFVHM